MCIRDRPGTYGRGLGSIRVLKLAWRALEVFFPLGVDKAISRGFTTAHFYFQRAYLYDFVWANDSTGYTLVEPRHIRVPFLYRHYTHAADWPAPHFTLICRGSARVYPAASFFVPNCTLLLRTCTLIRREIAGNKTLPPDHGITRHNKPQRPPDNGHNTA